MIKKWNTNEISESVSLVEWNLRKKLGVERIHLDKCGCYICKRKQLSSSSTITTMAEEKMVNTKSPNDYYFHKNAIGDGRCSIHATGDILGLSVEDTVNAFSEYTTRQETTSKTTMRDYEHILKSNADDETLSEKMKKDIESLAEYLEIKNNLRKDVVQLLKNGKWADSDAARGPEMFQDFVIDYFQRKCDFKVDVRTLEYTTFKPPDDDIYTYDQIWKLLENTESEKTLDDFRKTFLDGHVVIYVCVNLTHWHTIVPNSLRTNSSISPPSSSSSSSSSPSIPSPSPSSEEVVETKDTNEYYDDSPEKCKSFYPGYS
jgi:hypothetical protein